MSRRSSRANVKTAKPTYADFDHEKFRKTLRTKYTIKGEVGVLSYPFSKKVSTHWRFRTPADSSASAETISRMCYDHLAKLQVHSDRGKIRPRLYNWVRADICRKFLLMGYTRAMRYYYHADGRKWERHISRNGVVSWTIRPYNYDHAKKECAEIFRAAHDAVHTSPEYTAGLRWWNAVGRDMIFDGAKVT